MSTPIYIKCLKSHWALISLSLLSSILLTTTFAASANWQGPYIGAYLGSGYGNNHINTSVGAVTGNSYFATNADINTINNAGTWTKNPNTEIVGIQIGHDWIWKQMIYGIAMDYGALPLSSSQRISTFYSSNSDQYSLFTSMSTHQLFTLRGRLGYQTDVYWPSLFYLTGGAAITKLNVKNSFSDNSAFAGRGENQTTENQIGWTVGAGIELASFGNASLNIEYLYVRMPSVKTSSLISNTQEGFGIPLQSLTSPLTTTGQFHASLIRFGLNYRFDE